MSPFHSFCKRCKKKKKCLRKLLSSNYLGWLGDATGSRIISCGGSSSSCPSVEWSFLSLLLCFILYAGHLQYYFKVCAGHLQSYGLGWQNLNQGHISEIAEMAIWALLQLLKAQWGQLDLSVTNVPPKYWARFPPLLWISIPVKIKISIDFFLLFFSKKKNWKFHMTL